MYKVLIVGLGDVGCGLALALEKKGFEVTGIRRNIESIAESEGFSDIQLLSIDITQPFSDQLPNIQWDYVVVTVAPTEFHEQAFKNVYAKGAEHLAQALSTKRINPKRIFYVSSSGVYPQNSGEIVDETSETSASNYSSDAILHAENTLAKEFTTTIVRLTGIYGPGRTFLVKKTQEWLEKYQSENREFSTEAFLAFLAQQPELQYWSNRIHRDDCVGALAYLIEKDQTNTTLYPVYIGCDHQPTPIFEVLTWIASQLESQKNADITIDPSLTKSLSNKQCSGEALRALGYSFKYPTYREGYPSVLED